MAQQTLFNLPAKERSKPRVMMHVIDAGEGICRFGCFRCGHTTAWLQIRTTTEGRRGKPCPKCNEGVTA